MQEIADALSAQVDPFDYQFRVKGQVLQVQILKPGHDNYIVVDMASIRQDGGAYQVVWLGEPGEEGDAETKYDDLQALVADGRRIARALREG